MVAIDEVIPDQRIRDAIQNGTVLKENGQTPTAVASSTLYDAVGGTSTTNLPNTVYTYDAGGRLETTLDSAIGITAINDTFFAAPADRVPRAKALGAPWTGCPCHNEFVPTVAACSIAARWPELFRALSCNLERFGKLAGSEDRQVGGQLPQPFGFGGVGFSEFEQPCLPCDQIGCLRFDGQVEKMVILGMLRERKFDLDVRESIGEFEGLLENGGGVLGRKAGQSHLEFRAKEKSAQFIKQPLAHRQA